MLYTDHTVKANHAFKTGQLKDKDIDAVVKDVAKILPERRKPIGERRSNSRLRLSVCR